MTILTLTTDFGPGSSYVAALKGAVFSVNQAACLVDLSHAIPPQDLLYASFFLRTTVPFFPPGTLHVVVVDPGVGTARAILYAEVGEQRLLVPDNGCWTELCEILGPPRRVLRLSEPRYWRPQISSTFHGRDIFAPAAGHLSLGLDPALLGPPVSEWVRFVLPAPILGERQVQGEVLFIDSFGNLLTNLPAEALERWAGQPMRVLVGGVEIPRWVRAYGEAEPGSLVALISSAGTLEIAVSHGSAAVQLGADVGTPVSVELLS
jgi:S-adenosylmethionine hydrolase